MPFGRQICSCKHEYKHKSTNCYKCGIKKFDSQAIKTVGFSNPIHTSMKYYFRQMKNRSAKIVASKQISESTYALLTSICDKFSYGTETLALGLYIYQCLKDLSAYEKFWASCCLIVASKGIQLDKNVPYLNRYQRYADTDHTQEEYQKAQRAIFEGMNFDVQYSTFLTFVNYYLTNGIIYTHDNLNSSLVQYLQDDIILKSKQFLKKGDFNQYDQQKLALWIIKDTRRKYNLTQWTNELEELTGFKNEDINIQVQQKVLQVKKYDTNQSYTSVSKIQKVVDLKSICIRKKYDEIPVTKSVIRNSRPNSSVKQNTFSTSYQSSQNSMLYSTKPKSNIVLAPINTHFSANNSIFNLATKRR